MEALDDDLLTQPEDELPLTKKLTLIWTRPKRVFTSLLHSNKDLESFLLLFVTAIVVGLQKSRGPWQYISGETDHVNVLETQKNVAVFLGIYYAMVLLIRWTGTWLGGKAEFRPLAATYSYSNVPILFFIFLLSAQYICWSYLFSESKEYSSEFPPWYRNFSTVIMYLKYGANLYTLVLHIIAIAVVQQFGYFRALINLILALFFLTVPLVMITYLGWLHFML